MTDRANERASADAPHHGIVRAQQHDEDYSLFFALSGFACGEALRELEFDGGEGLANQGMYCWNYKLVRGPKEARRFGGRLRFGRRGA